MVEIVRLYQSETDAQKAIGNLKKEGFAASKIALVKADDSKAADQRVAEEIEAGRLPAFYRDYATSGLKQGRCMVVCDAPFGGGQSAEGIMNAAGPVATEAMPEWPVKTSRTTSSTFGIAELSERRFITIDESAPLARFRHVLGSFFGLGLQSSKAAPLSDIANIPTVQQRPKEWTKSMGYNLLLDNPAPLSAAVNYKTVSDRPKDWSTSFGLKLLAADRTPLSSFLSMPTLTKEQ